MHCLCFWLNLIRSKKIFQTPENWSQEKKGCIPAYSPWDSSSSASSSLSLRGSWSLKENFPERSRLQKAFLQKIYFPAPRERGSHENKLLLDSHGSFFRSKQKLQHTQLQNQTKEISTQMNFFIATINFDYKSTRTRNKSLKRQTDRQRMYRIVL